MAGCDQPSTAIGYHRARGSGLMSADIDVERARRDTPGTANVAHLHNAGAAAELGQDGVGSSRPEVDTGIDLGWARGRRDQRGDG